MAKMNTRIPVRPQQKGIPLSITAMNRMVALYEGEQWDALVSMAQEATKKNPQQIFGWKALSKALLMSGKPSEALPALSRLEKMAPGDPDIYSDLAFAFSSLGMFKESEKNYRQVLKYDPTSYMTYDKLGAMYCDWGQFTEAEAAFRRALELAPLFVQAHVNLGFALDKLIRWDEAEASYRRALEIDPNFFEALKRLAALLAQMDNRRSEAIELFERLVILDPQDVNMYLSLGNALMAEKRLTESHAMFRRAQQIQPIVTWPSKKKQPDFSVLLLDAPEVGCTPVNYLVGRTGYDSHFLPLLTGTEYDIDFLRSKADVVINMISDADNGKVMLPFASDIADRIGRPTVNHPRHVSGTDRESIAAKLSAIELCHISRTRRFSDAEMAGTAWQKDIEEFTLPLLVRCAGTHGGDDFVKVDDIEGIVNFVSNHPSTNYYVSEFVDYRKDDGYYRKYRLISLNDEILPYHLAIHDHWLVHHFRTDMANREWMRKEEEAFLKNPLQVFGEEHHVALRKIAAAVGLDYCGIDCALDREGKIVVFEANATMRVHDEINPIFLYKNPYISKIKEAFDLMLAKKVATRV